MNVDELIGTGPHWWLFLAVGLPTSVLFAIFFVFYSPIYWLAFGPKGFAKKPWMATLRGFIWRSQVTKDLEA